ncbi:MAG: hypothetical protein QOG64_878, partial [Acidimicrobiaceae bacterium]|nr:hypothetical protein [Acidimicrobiaceae bacterium]
ATAAAPAEVLQQKRIDALDITVLKGGGQAVGDWARAHGFLLTPDAPEVLDHYARQSPIFLAARFDAAAARERGQQAGDGTPIHITMPMDHPWVPLRILTLGRGQFEPVQADVFLLTDDQPKLSPGLGHGMTLDYSSAASDQLLQDLRSDKGMAWVPQSSWLSLVRIDASADQLDYDLSVDGGHPAGVKDVSVAAPVARASNGARPVHGGGGSLAWLWLVAGLVAAVAAGTVSAAVASARRVA